MNSRVLVPKTQWPDWTCSEEGWPATISKKSTGCYKDRRAARTAKMYRASPRMGNPTKKDLRRRSFGAN